MEVRFGRTVRRQTQLGLSWASWGERQWRQLSLPPPRPPKSKAYAGREE